MEICNTFKNYFSFIVGQLAQHIVNTDIPLDYLNDCNDVRFKFTPMTLEYVLEIISNLTYSSTVRGVKTHIFDFSLYSNRIF